MAHPILPEEVNSVNNLNGYVEHLTRRHISAVCWKNIHSALEVSSIRETQDHIYYALGWLAIQSQLLRSSRIHSLHHA